jgi:hypothetical protein
LVQGDLQSEAEKLKIRGLGVALIDSRGRNSYFCLGDAEKGGKVDEDSYDDEGSHVLPLPIELRIGLNP